VKQLHSQQVYCGLGSSAPADKGSCTYRHRCCGATASTAIYECRPPPHSKRHEMYKSGYGRLIHGLTFECWYTRSINASNDRMRMQTFIAKNTGGLSIYHGVPVTVPWLMILEERYIHPVSCVCALRDQIGTSDIS
jgi:hypothetical protein